MTLSRRMAFAVLSGWFSQIVSIVLQLVFRRTLFRHMHLEEQGYWDLLGNSVLFIALFDFGLAFTFTRRVALARGKSGSDPRATLTAESVHEIVTIMATGFRAYRVIATISFVASLGMGIWFLHGLKFADVSYQMVCMTWGILCLGYAINVWAQVWPCVLLGIGLVGPANMVSLCVNAGMLITQIILVLCGRGIVEMAIVQAGTGILNRQIGRALVKRTHPELFAEKGKWSRELFRSMISPSARAWLTAIGAFLIMKTDQYFIGAFVGAKKISPYSAAYQIMLSMYGFATAIASGSAVYVSHLWQAGDIKTVHAVVKRTLRMGMILLVCGAACYSVAAQPLIDLWLGPGNFVGYPVVWAFCLMLTLEGQHVMVSALSRATEDEAFAVPALVSGVLNLILTWIFVQRFANPLLGVAMGTVCAQILTNNWYAVYRPLRRLKMSVREHVKSVVLPIAGIFLLALGAGKGAMWLIQQWPLAWPSLEWQQALATAMGSGSVLAVSMWFYGFSSAQRNRILRRKMTAAVAAEQAEVVHVK